MLTYTRRAMLLALTTFIISSCTRKDDEVVVTETRYSGFMVDGTVYKVDSLVIDTVGPGCFARLYSATARGGVVEIQSPLDQWPANDSDYYYLITPPRALFRGADSAGVVSICFTPAGDSTPLFCLHPYTALTAPFGIQVRNGKRNFFQYNRNSNTEPNHTLGIHYEQR